MRFATTGSILLSLALAGCQGGSTMTAGQFTASATAPAPGLVKLVRASASNARVAVDVLIYGPAPDLDLAGFAFSIRIGDPHFVRFVPQAMYRQTALRAGDGQTIAIDVDGDSDPSLVQVQVEKVGGGAGNGVGDGSAVAIELVFELQGQGATSLTLAGLDGQAPRAFSSTRAPIAAVTFDDASATIRGVTTGGGRY